MARCERGYLCAVCGGEVEEITDSDLYLRYVLGEVTWDTLNTSPEIHIRCNPTVAQFIVADGFAPLAVAGPFSKAQLDPQFVCDEERRVTRGYVRLREVAGSNLPISEYPLPEVRARRRALLGECEE